MHYEDDQKVGDRKKVCEGNKSLECDLRCQKCMLIQKIWYLDLEHLCQILEFQLSYEKITR